MQPYLYSQKLYEDFNEIYFILNGCINLMI